MDSKTIFMITLAFLLFLPTVYALEEDVQRTVTTMATDAEVKEVSQSAKLTLQLGDLTTTIPARIDTHPLQLDSEQEVRCGVRDNQIVCQISSDELWCWGRGEISRCSEELSESDNLKLSSGGGAGKVSIQDFKTKSERDDEIEVFAWSWGRSISANDFEDVDKDELTLEYAWFVNSKSDDEKPSETLSLSFTKIEMAGFEDDDSITVDIENVRTPEYGILFGTLTLNEEAKKAITGRNPQTGKEIQIAAGIDEDGQEIPEEETIREYLDVDNDLSKADAKKALEGFTRSIREIQSSLERCESDVCRQVSANADKRHELVEKAKADIINSPPIVSEVRSIVLEDIALLERCEEDVCRSILSKEKGFIILIDSNINLFFGDDEFSNAGSGPPSTITHQGRITADGVYVDDSGDGVGIPARAGNHSIIKSLDKSTPTLFSAETGQKFNETERTQLREYLSSLEEVKGRDFGLAVALTASENERVRSVKYDEERNVVEIEHEEDMRLFGILRMNARSTTTVHEDGSEETKRPWWSFLASKQEGPKFKAGADLLKSVN